MKLLLTSQGLYNESIKQALVDLLGKPLTESNIVCITTSANGVAGDKRWLMGMLNNVDQAGFKTMDILDFSILPDDMLLPRLEVADVIFFLGGQSSFLTDEINRTGIKRHLDELLQTRVYMGNSAGSVAACKNLALSNPHGVGYSPARADLASDQTLRYVDFHIRPHYNHPDHVISVKDWVEGKIAEHGVTEKVYLIDDDTAIKVDGDTVEVISEGDWVEYN